MDKYLLQHIVFPVGEDTDYSELFLRNENGKYRFDTWVNLFAGKKWFHYGNLENLYLGVKASENTAIEIWGINKKSTDGDTALTNGENVSDFIFIKVPDPEKYEAIYFTADTEKLEAAWYTDTAPMRETKLAIVTCTYKKEEYIKKNVALFTDFIKNTPSMQNRMHLYISDNGRTLEKDIENEYVTLLPNKNAGGAGGFARGMIEAALSGKGFTRCAVMDDDVHILPECFYRTAVLSDYLKEEYKGAIINGAMIDLVKRNCFFENMGIREGIWTKPYHSEADLNKIEEVLRVNTYNDDIWSDPDVYPFAGWYYSSFPMDSKKTLEDLPMPIFIRGDDVEYGWRKKGTPFIQLNGICIWHASFYYRISKVYDSYYLIRNMTILGMIYNEHFGEEYQNFLIPEFKILLALYDYGSAEILIRAVRDVLKKEETFKLQPEELNNELGVIAKDTEYPVTEEEYPKEIIPGKQIASKRPTIDNSKSKILRAIFRIAPFTRNVFKKNSVGVADEWNRNIPAHTFHKKVKVYNRYKMTWHMAEFDPEREKKLTAEFSEAAGELAARFDELKAFYKEYHKTMTSYEFWKEYLDI